MPSWVFPAVLTGGLSLLTGALAVGHLGRDQIQRSQTGKQLDALRGDLKASEARQREEMREMRAEQRADNKALNEKLDCFLQSMMTAKAS
ncbi:MAG: hypothetical protein F4099_01810 [Synechococcus sp. SB0673_bin_10]|nr:hypothetical protein [Synechococcus sp. SB0667_bin_8]MYI71255.1 hypothetical protein [Synechococcus sp. SB0673_bin_10]